MAKILNSLGPMPLAIFYAFSSACDPESVISIKKCLPVYSRFADAKLIWPYPDDHKRELLSSAGAIADMGLCPERPDAGLWSVFSDAVGYSCPRSSTAVDFLGLLFGDFVDHCSPYSWCHSSNSNAQHLYNQLFCVLTLKL